MSKKLNGTPRLPDKDHLHVTEVARVLAPRLQITEQGAKNRIYRSIDDGRVKAVRVLGTIMIERSEAERIIKGEPA